jgi:hypothetical protein
MTMIQFYCDRQGVQLASGQMDHFPEAFPSANNRRLLADVLDKDCFGGTKLVLLGTDGAVEDWKCACGGYARWRLINP